jgi:hypothetical protein
LILVALLAQPLSKPDTDADRDNEDRDLPERHGIPEMEAVVGCGGCRGRKGHGEEDEEADARHPKPVPSTGPPVALPAAMLHSHCQLQA